MDNRLIAHLENCWNKQRGKSQLPRWDKFDDATVASFWPQCCVWELVSGVYTNRHAGEAVNILTRRDLTGISFASDTTSPSPAKSEKQKNVVALETVYNEYFRKSPIATLVKHIDRVVTSRAPLVEEGRFAADNNSTIRYRSILLPYANAAGDTSHILLGLSWRAY